MTSSKEKACCEKCYSPLYDYMKEMGDELSACTNSRCPCHKEKECCEKCWNSKYALRGKNKERFGCGLSCECHLEQWKKKENLPTSTVVSTQSSTPKTECSKDHNSHKISEKEAAELRHHEHKTEDWEEGEFTAMNIVHQIGDALYDALPPDIAHDHFVRARQATNDVAIDFAKKLITSLILKAKEEGRESLAAEYDENSAVILVGPTDNKRTYFSSKSVEFQERVAKKEERERILAALPTFRHIAERNEPEQRNEDIGYNMALSKIRAAIEQEKKEG